MCKLQFDECRYDFYLSLGWAKQITSPTAPVIRHTVNFWQFDQGQQFGQGQQFDPTFNQSTFFNSSHIQFIQVVLVGGYIRAVGP